MPHFLTPWEIGLSWYHRFYQALQQSLAEQRMTREAKLQLELAKPPPATVDGGEQRLVTRLNHNAAAVRPFLVHNQSMTDFSHNPMVHEAEKLAARKFVLDFHEAERILLHRLHISRIAWQAPGAGRDRLSQALARSPELYQQIAGFHEASKSAQDAAIAKLAYELQFGGQEEQSRKQQLQME